MSNSIQLQLPMDLGKQKTKRGGNWMRTYSGIQFWPLDPRPEEILITDIAHAQSLLCRFCGHVKYFYPIAQHSYFVSLLCDEPMKGLMHDGSEAYLTDLPTPIKSANGMEKYREAEFVLQGMIYRLFCSDDIETDNLRWADHQMLLIERQALKGSDVAWPEVAEVNSINIEPWTPAKAEEMFLNRFVELGGKL